MQSGDQIITNIRKIIRSLDLESKRIEKNYGMSIPQMILLTQLKNTPNFTASHKDLSKQLHLNTSTVTGIIDRLEKKGLVARTPKPDDKRGILVVLTKAGKQSIDRTPGLMQEKLLTKLQQAPKEDVRKIEEGLELLIKYLEIVDPEASSLLSTQISLSD
ncbi:MarR family transcriptional regulator [Cytophagales bacterium LB-30]|uniref:MarR family transcriptional regulator n=1 Tax=Shiella aurantiaca TaxID=3058365 RepID=A0ABT8F2Y5_9BACT|nr:MarR family transcriptional regulator [Shiella aurantiaca]MDN4164738.1 MarR family transcriptional regulator [Shiella aurantiaca]